ncbi:capsular polysaccharide synthesis protein [Limosilactobacillus mucosae]|uniref:capsular polysaccharide synthesis protein n=1 Tax=Limosilactobacillus mucosae TaxID=97478 RepID=UPI0025A4524C|nr:capsular polysaccharide synthesis protein [Limosilactobacillus mucosae]MDM8219013.1 capsular polysaccharide synthesis protein [Limosilactobacillus mucosae]MDM8313669.1 capsular polysaccharide synthesis protein [Limosilactobacillus mucosae]
MSLKEIFKKQGGMKLIRQYYKSGALGTAICEFVLLGKSRTALEILRLATGLKTKQHLLKKYQAALNSFQYDESCEHKSSNKVWVCWLQGMENAPEIVKTCYNSLKTNLPNKEIIVLTSSNLNKYVTFPNYIERKWKQGIISNAHLADLLRLELLTKFGGTWIDATVLCTEQEDKIPEYFFNSELFVYQCLKPGRDGHSTYMSNWYISAKSHNKILEATKYLCYEYWKRNNEVIDYFIFHDFMSIVLDTYKDDWHKIIPRDNATPHELLLRMFDKYNDEMWQAIVNQTPFHKLSYKFSKMDLTLNETYYQYIIKHFSNF